MKVWYIKGLLPSLQENIIISKSWPKLYTSVADVIVYILCLLLWNSSFTSLSTNLGSAMGLNWHLLFLHFSHIWLRSLLLSEWPFGILMSIITFQNKRDICQANILLFFFLKLQTHQKQYKEAKMIFKVVEGGGAGERDFTSVKIVSLYVINF